MRVRIVVDDLQEMEMDGQTAAGMIGSSGIGSGKGVLRSKGGQNDMTWSYKGTIGER